MDIITILSGLALVASGALFGAVFAYHRGYNNCLTHCLKQRKTPPQVKEAQERLLYGALVDEEIEERVS